MLDSFHAQLGQAWNKVPVKVAPGRLTMNADDNIVVRFAGRPFIHIVLGKAVSVEKTRLVGTSAVKCLVCCNHQADPWTPLMCPVGNALFFTDQT